MGAPQQARPGGQTNPSKSKPDQINPSKIAWIYLVLFVRNGAFQWVTANPNKKSVLLSGLAQNVPSAFTSHFLLGKSLSKDAIATAIIGASTIHPP
jgi:hypothetical protein